MRLFYIFYLLSLSLFSFAQEGYNNRNSHNITWLPDKYCGNIIIYKTYYNKYHPICNDLDFTKIELKADGYKILKDPKGFFYIRLINNERHADALRVYYNNELHSKVRVIVDNTPPLPNFQFYETYGGHEIRYMKFDSITLFDCYFEPTGLYSEKDNIPIYYENAFGAIFNIQAFSIEVCHYDRVVYCENIRGSKYSKKFQDFIRNNYLPYSPHYTSLKRTDTVKIKNILIRDDLGNTYCLPPRQIQIL